MKDSPEKISPLRRRMIEDMRMRKLSAGTQSGYIRAVRRFAGYLGRSPDTATDEDLRRYQLHRVDRFVSPITLNATITGLRFFFEVTLKRPELMNKMSHIRVARTLPVVLSREEAARSIESAKTLKQCIRPARGSRYDRIQSSESYDIFVIARIRRGESRDSSGVSRFSRSSPDSDHYWNI
jgi:hypothetical protein